MGERSTFREILDAVASGEPTPGGGHVSALAGALSASLYRMVINLTLPRKDDEAFRARGEAMLLAMEECTALADSDSAAYEEVVKALALPKETDADRERRRAAIEEATKGASLVPLETARKALALMRLGPELLAWGKKSCLSDTAVGFHMASAGFEGAVMNVKINIASIKDGEFRGMLEEELAPMLAEAHELRSEVASLVTL